MGTSQQQGRGYWAGIVITLAAALIATASSAQAQSCPPGQQPVVVQGVTSCSVEVTTSEPVSTSAGTPTTQGFPEKGPGLSPSGSIIDAPGWSDSLLAGIINASSGATDDPYLDISRTRDNGAGVTSASGTVTGSAQSSRITDIAGGVDGHFNGAHVFNLAANQSLAIGGFFYYDAQRTSYGSPTTILDASSAYRNIYTLGATARYDAGNTYFGGGVGGELGNGDLNGPGDTGAFNTHGYVAAAYVGQVFSLFNSVSSYAPSLMPTKAPPKPVSGYSVNLDVSAHISYSNDEIGGFTDGTGFVRGDERIDYWDVGGKAKLFWALPPYGRVTWSPFVAATIDQEFGYSHTLDIPVQTAVTADTLYYGKAQTFGGAQLGVDAVDASGIRFGINGIYRQSQEFQVFGGEAYVKFPIAQWFSVPAVMARN